MKKYTKILLCLLFVVLFVGCTPVATNIDNNDICVVEIGGAQTGQAGYEIFYDKDTGVCYIAFVHGGVSPLYNADGSLKTVDKESKDD